MQKKEREQFECPNCGCVQFIIVAYEEVTNDYWCSIYTDGDFEIDRSGNTYYGHSMDVHDEIECGECHNQYSFEALKEGSYA